jgi:hypothetical protein
MIFTHRDAGFSPITTTLLNLPLSTVQIVGQLTLGWLSAKIPNSRLHIASVAMVMPVSQNSRRKWDFILTL